MSVTIGEVPTFPDAHPNKEQVLKLLEECAEVYSAWEDWTGEVEADLGLSGRGWASVAQSIAYEHVIRECADVLQALSNLLAGMGVTDMRPHVESCRRRNEERGRM